MCDMPLDDVEAAEDPFRDHNNSFPVWCFDCWKSEFGKRIASTAAGTNNGNTLPGAGSQQLDAAANATDNWTPGGGRQQPEEAASNIQSSGTSRATFVGGEVTASLGAETEAANPYEATLLYEFIAEAAEELSCSQFEHVRVLQGDDDWSGCILLPESSPARIGWVPSSYLQRIG